MAAISICPSCATKNRVPTAAKGRPRCSRCKSEIPWLVDATDADFAAVARAYDASSIPTLVFLRDGAVVDRVVGAQHEPALASRIDSLLSS